MINIYQSADKYFGVKLYDRPNVPHTYSQTDIVKLALSRSRNRTGLAIETPMTYNVANGLYEVTLTAAQTAALIPDMRYWFDVIAVTSAGTARVVPITPVSVIPGIAEVSTT